MERNETQQKGTVGKLMTMKQACEYLNVSKWTLYANIKNGDIKPIVMLGSVCLKGFRFTQAQLDGLKLTHL